jgi:large subunit ribosomal protein L25
MKTIRIEGSPRKELGKRGSALLRKEGNVPCVIYGSKENTHFYAHENSFLKLVYTHETHLVNIIIEGQEIRTVMKDIQFHPVTDKILHVDFVEVHENKPVIINIPVSLTGDSVGIKAGGKLRMKRRNLKVKGYPNDIPEFLTVDVSNVKINHSVKVGDLAFDKLELLDPKIATILTIASSRVALKTEAEIAEEEAAATAEHAEAPAHEKE